MKLIRRAAMSALVAVALVIAPAASADAANVSFDVTKLSADNVVVSSWDCINTDVRMTHKKSGIDDWSVDTDVHGRNGLSTWASFASYSGGTKDRVQICPSSDGPGKYTLGPSEVRAYSYGDYSDYQEIERADHTKGSFYVRGKAYASLSAKRSGKTVTLTSTTKVYSPEDYGKVNYNPKVKFQVKSGSTWKTIKTVSAKKGKTTLKVTSKGKKTYRVTFDQVSWATGATSKTAKR
ncbi:hypothetical protein [Brevibacterium casei]|uniref:Uncharacterized protein n=2 Tax=Brevibacterium casei TaxID=33889 RepID=A0A2H1JHE4_9MICO|nr:hypothetical protein [Brevibacterium casei]QPR39145.1 hypothetical protein I6G94_16685 [Brevibacterium casei]QPR43311.1 hypothetical protein I6G93_14330 [Brevibacterium casei]QPS34798.1 hypothetical protein I6G59_05675 [Brevibacterium casei]SMX86945.1 hypothetical protein BC102111_02267 [Brevibacterium casei CIP 102111]